MAGVAELYRTDGKIDYTPSGSSLSSGDVVDLGAFVAIAVGDIADGETGTLQTPFRYIYNINKYASEQIDIGTTMYYDAATETATKTGAYSEGALGVCVKTAAAGDARVLVALAYAP